MSSVKENLPTMMSLARDRSELARLQLANMLTDVFLQTNASLSMREEEMVNELIDQLMFDCTPKVRTQLIEKFADVTRMPRRIASNLAKENLEIARPILVSNKLLTDADLIDVIEGQGADHALAIATRARISEAVADALVTTGDVRVMREVAENLGAQLSPQAISIVADAARYSSELRKPLLYRPEMNMQTALKMYWWVEQDLRRYSLKRFGISTGQIDQSLAQTISAFLEDHARERSNDEVMKQVADWMEKHQAISISILPQVLRLGHFRLFNMLLSRLSGLSLSLIDTITGEVGGRGLASVCRAIGIDKPGFVSLFLLSRGGRPGEQIVHPRELSYALATFDRMTPAIAKDLLHSWSVNPEYFSKHRDETTQETHTAS